MCRPRRCAKLSPMTMNTDWELMAERNYGFQGNQAKRQASNDIERRPSASTAFNVV
jgi:hypothetical protein